MLGSVAAPSALGDGHRLRSIIQQLRLLINSDIIPPGVLLEPRLQRTRHGAFAQLLDGYISSAPSRLVVTSARASADCFYRTSGLVAAWLASPSSLCPWRECSNWDEDLGGFPSRSLNTSRPLVRLDTSL